MLPENFPELLEFTYKAVIRKWIPDLAYHTVSPPEAGKESDAVYFDEERSAGLKAHSHCLQIDGSYLVFTLEGRSLSSIERAFIDWCLDKTLEYSRLGLDYTLREAIKDILPRLLVATCLSFPDYDLSYSWKHLHGNFSYFGPTAAMFGLSGRELFSREELELGDTIYDLLRSMEDLSDSTNEGERFNSTVCFINGMGGGEDGDEDELHGPDWQQMACEQFIKSLSGSNTVFVVNRKGRLIDYVDIALENLDEEFSGALGSAANISSGADDDAIFNYIFNFQINNPDKDIFFVSSKDNGDIFVYKNRTVMFFRRGKVWHFLNYKAIADIVRMYTGPAGKKYGDAINLTIIDMLLDHSGCCLGLVPLDVWLENFDEVIAIGKVDEFLSGNPAIRRCFWANSRTVRKRLLSIDGAVLLAAESGEIYNVGAIIPNSGASSQGARTTATRTIARMGGIAIKISDDGYCEIYEPGRELPSFVIGK